MWKMPVLHFWSNMNIDPEAVQKQLVRDSNDLFDTPHGYARRTMRH